ncbi:Anti-lipopolysaccharide factor, partial [Armadillidium nasatum]
EEKEKEDEDKEEEKEKEDKDKEEEKEKEDEDKKEEKEKENDDKEGEKEKEDEDKKEEKEKRIRIKKKKIRKKNILNSDLLPEEDSSPNLHFRKGSSTSILKEEQRKDSDLDIKDVISNALSSTFETESIEFLGHQCLYTSTPTFRGWELHFLAKFWCPSLATFTATAMSRSPSGSVKEATKMYAKMGVERKLFTTEEVSLWLQ